MMTMECWNDQIVLRWDGKTLPANCKHRLDAVKARPDLLLGSLEHIQAYTRFSEKKQAFFLALSKQNLQRIYKQFGKIDVKSGYQGVQRVKDGNEELKKMQTISERLKSGQTEDIPYKLPPLAPYQHIGTNVLTFCQRVPLFADCGCLSGDTEIRFNRGGISRKITLRELYIRENNPRGNRKNHKTNIRAFNGERIALHPLRKVVESGIKEVLLLTLEDGKSIKATPDHEILTKRGWVELKDLTLEDEVMVDNLVRHQKKKEKSVPKKFNDKRVAVGRYHPYGRYQSCHGGTSGSFLVEKHRAIYEAHINKISYEEFIKRTYTGVMIEQMEFVNPATHYIHHKNGDHYDNRPKNLTALSQLEHAQLHTLGYTNFGHGLPVYSKVKSVTPVGKEMTYDIVCEDPHRNFVANGIVVHNCGKTYMVLTSTQEQFRRGLVAPGKVLICGKLATLETGWLADCEKFTHMKAVMLWAPPGAKRKEKLLALLNTPADIYVINHDGIRVLEDELAEKRFDKVVVDESTILKSFHSMAPQAKSGAFGKALMNVAKHARWRVVMSGTPAPNGVSDLWGQFFFLDPLGLLLERSYHDFCNTYMKQVFFGDPKNPNTPSKWIEGSNAYEVYDRIAPLAYRVRIRDHLTELPEKTVIKRTCAMGPEQLRHYQEMEVLLRTEIDEKTIMVDQQLSKLGKLRQVTGGFLIDHQENAHPIDQNPKLELLDSLLEDEIDASHKVVIYAQYRWEIETIAARYKEHGVVTVYGGNKSQDNLDNIKSFINDSKIRIIVLHPKSAAHGITFTCAHYMIFYSISYSEEDNYQCIARIERAGQKHPMFVYYLLAKNSIDEIIFSVLKEKQAGQKMIIDQDLTDREIVKRWFAERENNASKPRRKAKAKADTGKAEV